MAVAAAATAVSLSGDLSRPEVNFPPLQVPRTHFLQTRCLWKMATFHSSNSRQTHHKIPFAYGKENVNEDTDDTFDELFNKYGKVVFRRNDKRPPSAEVDDDAESLSFAVAMAEVASEVKAADIKVLFVKPLVYWTRFFIIATAFSRPQIDAIGSRIRDLAETKYGKVPSGDSKPNSWTLLDFAALLYTQLFKRIEASIPLAVFWLIWNKKNKRAFIEGKTPVNVIIEGDVVIHIFLPQQREFYNLDDFYGNATPIELPFENQPPFRP